MNALLDMIVSIHAYLWDAGIGLHPLYRKKVLEIGERYGFAKAMTYIEIVNPLRWIAKDVGLMLVKAYSYV